MNAYSDLLLKLHYLDLEINEIYQIMQKFKKTSLSIALKNYFPRYQKLDVSCIKSNLDKHNIKYVTILDENYPKKLENIYMPPLVLFYQGDLSLLDHKMIAVIGARDNSEYGKEVTKIFVRELVKQQIYIISGLAYGIDTIAHKSSMECMGKTIAVLGSGINQIYPLEHTDIARKIGRNHLLLSEYPPFAKGKKTHFPFRNRIVSGLSDGVLVIEAKKRSGTLITCDYALDQGKDIFVVPNHIFAENSEGTNNLIKQGAYLVTSVDDILEKIKH